MDKDTYINRLTAEGVQAEELSEAVPVSFIERWHATFQSVDNALTTLIAERDPAAYEGFVRVLLHLIKSAPTRHVVAQQASKQAAQEADTEAYWAGHWSGSDA